MAQWVDSETSRSNAEDVLNAIRPGMITVPGARLLCITSPWSGRALPGTRISAGTARTIRCAAGVPGASPAINPNISGGHRQGRVARDRGRAQAEYLAQFRDDLETLFGASLLASAVAPGDREHEPRAGVAVNCFVDTSAGRNDSYTMAIAHRGLDGRRISIACASMSRLSIRRR